MRPRAVIADNVVQIRFLLKDSSLSATPVELDKVPVVNLASIGQPDSEVLTHPAAIGLIDSGCDHYAIDSTFAKQHGFIAAGTTSPSGAGGYVRDTPYFRLDFAIQADSRLVHMTANFVAIPFRETGRRYDVILGMSFINKGRLILDSQVNQYLFEFS